MADLQPRKTLASWRWAIRQLGRRLWVRAALYSLVAIGTAMLAIPLRRYIPDDLPATIGSNAVDGILSILASSMLAVTTFSLSTMVVALGAATSNVTPRATQLLMEDPTAQNALASFLGSFLFSLVGLIALSTGIYGEDGRVVLFAVTLVVIVVIVVTLLRWIDHLSRLGRVVETTRRVETAAIKAMEARLNSPALGGHVAAQKAGAHGRAVHADCMGYVQHIDASSLQQIAEQKQGHVMIALLPGALVDPSRVLAWTTIPIDKDSDTTIRDAFIVRPERTYDDDPRFGVSVLAEIASRALSPAVNDPGTAIDVIGRGVRVLALPAMAERNGEPAEVKYDRVSAPALELADLFDDFFTPIARDGAPMVEVGTRSLKALASLARLGGAEAAVQASRHARLLMKRAEKALEIEEDREILRALATDVGADT